MSHLADDSWPAGSRELPEGPEFELQILASAADRVRQDLQDTFDPRLRVEVFLDDDESTICHIFDGDQLSTSLYVDVSDDLASTTVTLVESVQDSDVFYGHWEPWPACPLHPNAGHSLAARRYGKEPWWACPTVGTKVLRVGQLGGGTRT